ncbi:MAG: hypothetical protein ACLVBP_09780 [Ruminococcus sp.]
MAEKTDHGHALAGTPVESVTPLGHPREPSETNAHPHTSDDGNVVGVTMIIENYTRN